MPPFLMRIKLVSNRKRINLWIPLFLFWMFAGLLGLALCPLIILLAVIFWPTGWGKVLWQAGPRLYSILCALKGLEVSIRGKDQVLLYFK